MHPKSLDLSFTLTVLIAAVLLLILYPEVWAVGPARDDYMPPMAEFHRGMARGPVSFFIEPSSFPFYRPLTFLSIWLAGLVSFEGLVTIIHGLHFFWVVACLGVLALWARSLGFSRAAFVFCALIFITHPVLAGPLASIDGFQRVASTAWTWLGAWFVLRSPRGSLASDLAATACLVIGLGFAEYALGLVPMALMVALWRRQSGRSWGSILRLGALLLVVVAAWYVLRSAVIGAEATMFVSLRPDVWVINTARLLAVSLFWGNSIWSMLGPQPFAALATVAAVLLAVFWLGRGLWRRIVASGWPPTLEGWLVRADTGLLLPLTLLAVVPMPIMPHVSEMFATPILMGVALLAGQAMEGWLGAPRGERLAAFGAAALAVVVGVVANWAKIGELAAAGRRSDHQVQQVLRHIPPDVRGWRIATLFEAAPPEPRYSVFLPWRHDSEVVRTDTLAWFHPDRALELERLILPDDCDRAGERFDLILAWDRAEARYRPVDGEAFEARCRG